VELAGLEPAPPENVGGQVLQSRIAQRVVERRRQVGGMRVEDSASNPRVIARRCCNARPDPRISRELLAPDHPLLAEALRVPGRRDEFAGFLALEVPEAEDVSRRLREQGVLTDSRGRSLRLGPCAVLTDDQLTHRRGCRGRGGAYAGVGRPSIAASARSISASSSATSSSSPAKYLS
jgi:hypothetical protein